MQSRDQTPLHSHSTKNNFCKHSREPFRFPQLLQRGCSSRTTFLTLPIQYFSQSQRHKSTQFLSLCSYLQAQQTRCIMVANIPTSLVLHINHTSQMTFPRDLDRRIRNKRHRRYLSRPPTLLSTCPSSTPTKTHQLKRNVRHPLRVYALALTLGKWGTLSPL